MLIIEPMLTFLYPLFPTEAAKYPPFAPSYPSSAMTPPSESNVYKSCCHLSSPLAQLHEISPVLFSVFCFVFFVVFFFPLTKTSPFSPSIPNNDIAKISITAHTPYPLLFHISTSHRARPKMCFSLAQIIAWPMPHHNHPL